MVSFNLLQIKTYPTKIEINSEHGLMKNPKAPDPLIDHSVTPGGYEIKTTPAELQIDNYPMRKSMGILNDMDMLRKQTQKGKEVCAEATVAAVQYGDALLDKITPAELSRQKTLEKANVQTQTVFMPDTPPDVHFERGGVELEYTPFKANIDWNNLQIAKMEFERGGVDINVVQKAYTDIQYLGGPDYFPDDANPDIKFNTSV